MKAILCTSYGSIDGLTYGEIAPRPLRDTEVRVALHAAAVNFMDVLMVQGLYQMKPPLPFVPGTDGAGIVAEVGARVTRCKPGDRVSAGHFYGTYAEEVVAPEHWVYPLPDRVSFAKASALRVGHGTALFALEQRAALRAGEVLLVTGAAGGVGLAAVELGRLMGARVIAAVGDDAKAGLVRRYGAEHVVNYRTESLRDRIKDLTGGNGADVIFEVVGGEVFDHCLRSVAWNGRLLVVGFTSGRIPAAPANLPLLKNSAVVGVFFGAWVNRDPAGILDAMQRLHGWCAEGRIDPHVSATLPLRDAVQGMRAIAERTATGRIVLQVR